jgi:hypothetical protein
LLCFTLSAYVSIRQHTSAYASRRTPRLALLYSVGIRQHTPAYVSICQHMSAYGQHT